MGHNISAIIAKAGIDEKKAKEFDLPVFMENGYAIIALDEGHSDFWTERLGLTDTDENQIILDCKVTHLFAREIGIKRYAIINTDYFGGVGEQYAAVYEDGKVIMKTEEGRINKALKLLGVKCTPGYDEFDSIGLGKYRSFDDLFEKYWDNL